MGGVGCFIHHHDLLFSCSFFEHLGMTRKKRRFERCLSSDHSLGAIKGQKKENDFTALKWLKINRKNTKKWRGYH